MKKEGSATHKAVAVDVPARAARAVEDVPEAGTGRCQNGEKQGREPPPAPLWARRGQSSHPDIANSRVCGSADGANGVGGDDVEVVPSHAEAKATFFMTAAEKRAAKLEEEERERARRAEQAREEFQKEKGECGARPVPAGTREPARRTLISKLPASPPFVCSPAAGGYGNDEPGEDGGERLLRHQQAAAAGCRGTSSRAGEERSRRICGRGLLS